MRPGLGEMPDRVAVPLQVLSTKRAIKAEGEKTDPFERGSGRDNTMGKERESVATTAVRSLTRTCRIWRSDASGEASGR